MRNTWPPTAVWALNVRRVVGLDIPTTAEDWTMPDTPGVAVPVTLITWRVPTRNWPAAPAGSWKTEPLPDAVRGVGVDKTTPRARPQAPFHVPVQGVTSPMEPPREYAWRAYAVRNARAPSAAVSGQRVNGDTAPRPPNEWSSTMLR